MAEQRALTTDDYLKAASIVATCRNERLPYVLHYLEQGGFARPNLAEASCGITEPAQAIRLIMDAKAQYGMSYTQIGKIVGLDRVQICRYANGQCGMKPQRATYIVHRLTDALSQMQENETNQTGESPVLTDGRFAFPMLKMKEGDCMAGQADGSIVIDTKLDSKGFKAGSDELRQAIRSISGQIKKMQKQMRKVGTQSVPTDAYLQVQKDIAQAEKYLDQYNQKLAKLSEKGKVGTSEWNDLKSDISAASEELERLLTLKTELEQSEQAYTPGTETIQYQSMSAALSAAKQQLLEMQKELSRVTSKWAQMPTLSGYVKSALQGISDKFKFIGTALAHPLQSADRILGGMVQKSKQMASKLVSGLKAAASSMAKMLTHSKSMNVQFGGLISGAKKFALSLLGARGVWALLRKAVSAYMSENQQLSNTLSSCWSGIGNLLGPIISKIINLVATAVSYVTSFLKLFGVVGKSTTKAISSAGGAAVKETDKLKRQLASFDELNILSDSKSGGGGGGGSGGADTSGSLPDMELPDWAKLFADQLKAGDWGAAALTLTDQLLLRNFS